MIFVRVFAVVFVAAAAIAGVTYVLLFIPNRRLHRSREMLCYEIEFISRTGRPPPHWATIPPEAARRSSIRRVTRLIDLCRSHAVGHVLPHHLVANLEQVKRDWEQESWDPAPVD
jgi:hypothetical protein